MIAEEFRPENTYMHGGHRTCKACRRLNHHTRKAS